MKAFVMALCALVVITVGANRILVAWDFSQSSVSASQSNVRIHD